MEHVWLQAELDPGAQMISGSISPCVSVFLSFLLIFCQQTPQAGYLTWKQSWPLATLSSPQLAISEETGHLCPSKSNKNPKGSLTGLAQISDHL